jgi:Tol biopolymer transport system component
MPSMPARLAVLLAFALAIPLVPAPSALAAGKPSNGAIAYSANRADTRAVYTRAPDGSALSLAPSQGKTAYPAFSPGGKRLAFTQYGPYGAQVWVSYLDGVGLRPLTTGPTDTMPEWSPDGTSVAFVRGARGARDIYTTLADGTAVRRLTYSGRDDETPAWSVNGRLAFVRQGATTDRIYTMTASGGTATPLLRDDVGQGFPAWSPTGRTLVFSKGEPGRRDLYVVRSDGSGERRLTSVRGDETEPTWSPDGKRIAFAYRRAGKRALYIIKPRGKAIGKFPARGVRVRRLTSTGSKAASPSWQPVGLDPVIAAAGDIACDPADPGFNGGEGVPGQCRQRLTSDLLLRMDLASILVVGDEQYEGGELSDFMASFDRSWGRLKPLIRPVPGNHEYAVPNAAGYFDYFNGPGLQDGPAGDRSRGYYSFDVGSWHIVALNSECANVGGCGDGSLQLAWLRADLATHPNPCTLAFLHRPRFTSGRFSDGQIDVLPLYQALYDANADLILAGHEHFYERFAPQDPTGNADAQRGIRQLTVGMGGKGRTGFVAPAPNSEIRDNRTTGVAALTLREGSYDWRLVQAPSGRSADVGSGTCH